MKFLRWLRGDIDAFHAAESEAPSYSVPVGEDSGRPLPPDALGVDVSVESRPTRGSALLELEGLQPRVRLEGERMVVEIDVPGLREDTVAVEKGEAETRVTGERESGSIVVRLRANPPPATDEIETDVGDDVLTISFPSPYPN
jgi:hypothetical protein